MQEIVFFNKNSIFSQDTNAVNFGHQ